MRGVWQWIETWLVSVLHGAATALGQRLVDALLERVGPRVEPVELFAGLPPDVTREEAERARGLWWLHDYTATCRDCGWSCEGVAAPLRAHRHGEEMGHTVDVRIRGDVTVGVAPDDEVSDE